MTTTASSRLYTFQAGHAVERRVKDLGGASENGKQSPISSNLMTSMFSPIQARPVAD